MGASLQPLLLETWVFMMFSKMRAVVILISAALFSIAVVSCSNNATPESQGQQQEIVVVLVTPTPTPAPTSTTTPTLVPTSTSTPTLVPTSTSTPTLVPTSTSAPTPVPTSTSMPTLVPTSTSTPTPAPTSTLTPTLVPTPTFAPTPVPLEYTDAFLYIFRFIPRDMREDERYNPELLYLPVFSGSDMRHVNYCVDAFRLYIDSFAINVAGDSFESEVFFASHGGRYIVVTRNTYHAFESLANLHVQEDWWEAL